MSTCTRPTGVLIPAASGDAGGGTPVVGPSNRRVEKCACQPMRHGEGWVQVRRVAKARTFSRSTSGSYSNSQRAAALPGRHSVEQVLRVCLLDNAEVGGLKSFQIFVAPIIGHSP